MVYATHGPAPRTGSGVRLRGCPRSNYPDGDYIMLGVMHRVDSDSRNSEDTFRLKDPVTGEVLTIRRWQYDKYGQQIPTPERSGVVSRLVDRVRAAVGAV